MFQRLVPLLLLLQEKIVPFALVALGGAIGSVSRYLLAGLVQRASGSLFPFGTLAVNLLGCLLIGLLAPLVGLRSTLRLFLLIGVLGGFTTFSTFGLETFRLLEDREYLRAAANVFASVVVGLAGVWAGYRITEHFYGVGP